MGPVLIIALIKYAIIVGALYFAVKLPMQIGGAFMSLWSGSIGKPLAGWAGKLGERGFAAGRNIVGDHVSNKMGNVKLGEKIKSIPVPSKIYAGWKKGSDEEQAQFDEKESGLGRSFRETALNRVSFEKSYRDQAIKASKAEIDKIRAERMTGSTTDIRNSFDNGVKDKNKRLSVEQFKVIGAELTSLAERGVVKKEDLQSFMELAYERDKNGQIVKDENGNNILKAGFRDTTVAVDALVAQLSKQQAHNNNLESTVISQLNSDGTKRSSHDIQKDYENILDTKINSGIDTEARATRLNKAYNRLLVNPQGELLDYDKLDDEGKALANILSTLKGTPISARMVALNQASQPNMNFSKIQEKYTKPESVKSEKITEIVTSTVFSEESEKDITEGDKSVVAELKKLGKVLTTDQQNNLVIRNLANAQAYAQRVYTGKYDFGIPPNGTSNPAFARKVIEAKHHEKSLNAFSSQMMAKLSSEAGLTPGQINIGSNEALFQGQIDYAKSTMAGPNAEKQKRALAEMVELKKRHDAIQAVINSKTGTIKNNVMRRIAESNVVKSASAAYNSAADTNLGNRVVKGYSKHVSKSNIETKRDIYEGMTNNL